jgi:hypothetical protein
MSMLPMGAMLPSDGITLRCSKILQLNSAKARGTHYHGI